MSRESFNASAALEVERANDREMHKAIDQIARSVVGRDFPASPPRRPRKPRKPRKAAKRVVAALGPLAVVAGAAAWLVIFAHPHMLGW